jgi:hypothetical protein
MPQRSAPGFDEAGRIDADDDAPQFGRAAHARGFDHRARPQRVGTILDDLAVDLLAAEPRALVAREHVRQKRRR